jgi:hypothetical protein
MENRFAQTTYVRAKNVAVSTTPAQIDAKVKTSATSITTDFLLLIDNKLLPGHPEYPHYYRYDDESGSCYTKRKRLIILRHWKQASFSNAILVPPLRPKSHHKSAQSRYTLYQRQHNILEAEGGIQSFRSMPKSQTGDWYVGGLNG